MTTGSQDAGAFLPYFAVTLADGREVVVRPMNASDFEAERAFILALSPRSRRNRFQEQMREPSDELVASLVNVDHDQQEAFAALAGDGNEVRIVGTARYVLGGQPGTAEFAVTVLDDWQGQGLGSALLERLIATARQCGVHRLLSLDFAQNHEMTHLVQHFGFTSTTDHDDPTQLVHTLDL